MNQPSCTVEARPLRRAASLALATVVAVLAVTSVASGVAGAAPPLSLTATPNPVVIPLTKTSGTYDLSWSTGSTLPAEFTLSLDNGAPVVFNQVPAGTASGISIDYGHTHTWKLYTKGSVRPLKTVTVTTRRPDQSCAGNCLKDVTMTPHGTFADVKVLATAKLATYELTASKTSGGGVVSAMIGWDTQTWNSQLLSLEPGTSYSWNLKVRDEAGNTQVKNGSFTTLKRQVTYSFDSITVTDDSDDLSEGDLDFWFNAADWDNTGIFSAGVDTGDTVNPGYSRVVVGGPDIVKLGVYGWDDDCGPFTLCSFGSAPGGSDGGSHSEADWATAWTTVNTLVSGPGESFSAPFSMSTSGYALKFVASGSFSVTYI